MIKIVLDNYTITEDENGVLEVNASVGTLNLVPRSNTRVCFNIVKKSKEENNNDNNPQ